MFDNKKRWNCNYITINIKVFNYKYFIIMLNTLLGSLRLLWFDGYQADGAGDYRKNFNISKNMDNQLVGIFAQLAYHFVLSLVHCRILNF